MTVRYRDLAVMVQFGVQLWMYASCVVYPAGDHRPGQCRNWFHPQSDGADHRDPSAMPSSATESSNPGNCWSACGMTAVLLFIGMILFAKIERTHLDSV